MGNPTDTPFRGYVITHILDCLADPSRIRVIAEAQPAPWPTLGQGRLDGSPVGNVGEILPYLNAMLPSASYSPGANTLTFRHDYRLITLYPHVALIAKADDEADALAVLAWLEGLINTAYARRHEIIPCYDRRHTVGFLDVYRLLPGGNCKACGLPTCLAFAVALLDGNAVLQDCAPLDRDHAARLADLLPRG
jgi:ArsR family metal-binding transcriptional regulator